MLVEDKHSISVLTEQLLYPRLRAFDEDEGMDLQLKEENKKKAIEIFVKEYTEKSTLLSEDEVRDLVNDVLSRMKQKTAGIDR